MSSRRASRLRRRRSSRPPTQPQRERGGRGRSQNGSRRQNIPPDSHQWRSARTSPSAGRPVYDRGSRWSNVAEVLLLLFFRLLCILVFFLSPLPPSSRLLSVICRSYDMSSVAILTSSFYFFFLIFFFLCFWNRSFKVDPLGRKSTKRRLRAVATTLSRCHWLLRKKKAAKPLERRTLRGWECGREDTTRTNSRCITFSWKQREAIRLERTRPYRSITNSTKCWSGCFSFHLGSRLSPLSLWSRLRRDRYRRRVEGVFRRFWFWLLDCHFLFFFKKSIAFYWLFLSLSSFSPFRTHLLSCLPWKKCVITDNRWENMISCAFVLMTYDKIK